MQDGFGAGDIGQETAGGETIGAEGDTAGADDVGQIESVSFEERLPEETARDFEADVTEIGRRRKTALAELVDIEGELGLDMSVGIFRIVNGGAVTLFKLREFDGDREVDGAAVTDGVADVMGERADGEGKLVGGAGVADERKDEVTGADVVGKVGEETIAEGVIAEVLDSAATVGIAMRFLQLGFGEVGVVFEEDGTNRLLPGEIDELFVGLDRVGSARRGGENEGHERYRFEEGGAAWKVDCVASKVVFGASSHCTERE